MEDRRPLLKKAKKKKKYWVDTKRQTVIREKRAEELFCVYRKT